MSHQSFHGKMKYSMKILKKLAITPLFLIVFAILIYQLITFLKSYDFIFSLSLDSLIQFIIVAILISLSSFLFVLLSTFASSWKISIPAGAAASILPLAFINTSLAQIFTVGIFLSFLLAFLSLSTALKSYLTFSPKAILGPAIRQLSGLLIISFCIVYFFSASKMVAEKGFQIPDSLIDTALKMTPMDLSSEQNPVTSQLPTISQEQINFLKQNPNLLKQSGLDPKILDTLNQPKPTKSAASPTRDLIKQTVKNQIQGYIKPYQNFIPAGLALLLFLTLQSLTSLVNLLIYPLLWLTFYVLAKTGFVKFEIEQRPVKKLIV